jgi:hypothetical protein
MISIVTATSHSELNWPDDFIAVTRITTTSESVERHPDRQKITRQPGHVLSPAANVAP